MKIWADREVVTNEDINANFAEAGEADSPLAADDYSATVGQMRSQVDPAPGGIESLATSLAGELERLRYVLARIAGEAFWYSPLDNDLAAGHPKFWGATYQNVASIADPAAPFIGSINYYAKDIGGGKAALAYINHLGEVYTLTSVLAGDSPGPTPAVAIGVSAQIGIVVSRESGTALRVRGDRLTVKSDAVYALDQMVSSAASGLNGLDTGVITANTFYNLFVLYNVTTAQKGTLLSASLTPLVPAGFQARMIGGWRTDGTAQFVAGGQLDDTFVYGRPILLGTFTAGENVAFSVAPFVPDELKDLNLVLQADMALDTHIRLHHTTMAVAGLDQVVSQVTWTGGPDTGGTAKPTAACTLRAGGRSAFTFYYSIPLGVSAVDVYVAGWTIAWRDP